MDRPISVGDLIGDRYELVKLLNKTSMSTVFKAWDRWQEYFVVVKIAINNSLVPNAVDCLKHEALALQRIGDPHVVHLFDYGDIGESYFVVLEYLYGMDLRPCLNMGKADKRENACPLPPSVALWVMIEVLDGLKAMHEEGLVHRDIKPENLMTTGDEIKIIDLGLVKFLSTADPDIKSLDIHGTATGTPPYLSPEQCQAADNLDCRSDLYACGVVLYELLTGVLPFPTPKERRKLLEYWKFPMLKFSEVSLAANIPDKVQDIVWKALEVDPANRYQTAEEMRMALLVELGSYTKIVLP